MKITESNQRTKTINVRAPAQLIAEFTAWCQLRGLSRTGKLRRMMDLYVRDKIEDGKFEWWKRPHWRKRGWKLSMEKERFKYYKEYRDEEIDSFVITNVPLDLYNRFDAYCSLRGFTKSGKLRRIMFDVVKGNIKLKKRKEKNVP